MLKPEILDPQGQAIVNALPRLGFTGITAVRQGKRFEVEIEGELTEDALEEITRVAGTLLSNPVIEDFAIRGEVEVEGNSVLGGLPSGSEASGSPIPQKIGNEAPRAAAEAAAQGRTPPAGVTSDQAAAPKPEPVE
jgi:phosphoribosylformylglycinamidine synthase